MGLKIPMPQLGESVVEGKVVNWFVKVGDHVEIGMPMLEVETDKANTEVSATAAGFVSAILVPAGETVGVGTPMVELVDTQAEVGGGAGAPAPAPAPAPVLTPVAPAPAPVAVPAAPVVVPAMPAVPPPPAISFVPSVPAIPSVPAASGPAVEVDRPWNHGGVVATPAPVRALPIAQSRIAAPPAVAAPPAPPAASVASVPAPPAIPGAAANTAPFVYPGTPTGLQHFKAPVIKALPGDKVTPFSKRRSIIAEHMVYSKHVSPHVPCFAEVDVTDVMALRKQHQGRLQAQGISLSLLAFLLKATCQALREIPVMNSVVGNQEVIQRANVNLGVAVETDGGLVVPVIRDADARSVGGLAQAVGDMAEKARTKQITLDDLAGGTFTVSNPGRKGNLFGAAIINQPQVGILRMGEVVRRAVVRSMDGEEVICIRSMMYLSLSYDHRIIDGVAGNGFLFRVRELLEEAKFEI